MAKRWGFVFACCVMLLAGLALAEIHRAKALKSKQPKRKVPQTDYKIWPPGYLDGPRADEYPKLATESQRNEQEPVFFSYRSETWILSMLSAVLVGLSGIFPLLVIPLEAGEALRHGTPAARLKMLLSFAVGGLLGDVFLHLLPEAWANINPEKAHEEHSRIGLWVLSGIFVFLIIEKAFPDHDEGEGGQAEEEGEKEVEDEAVRESTEAMVKEEAAYIKEQLSDLLEQRLNGLAKVTRREVPKVKVKEDGDVAANGQHADKLKNKLNKNAKNSIIQAKKCESKAEHRAGSASEEQDKESGDDNGGDYIRTSGWLNLMANVIDNFTHGLAVAGSYCISTKTGVITTIAILMHEIPHEVGDFAILLRAGFDRWKAAKAQLLTATGGLMGAITALSAESTEAAGDKTAWILPFTAGGFIYISLVTIVPDLLRENNIWNSIKQVLLMALGIGAMLAVNVIFE